MSTYRKIHGRSIQAVTTDPSGDITEGQVWYNTSSDTFKSVIAIEAWSSGGSLGTARYALGAAGTQDAGLAFGGAIPPSPGFATQDLTEEYNGSGWATVGALGTARYYIGGCGTQTAGLAFGGNHPDRKNETEEYNGTSWSEQNNLSTARRSMGSSGTQTAALASGGDTPPGVTVVSNTEQYDGTSWTNGGALNTARSGVAMGPAGTQTAGVIAGGYTGSASAVVEHYDGSSWTNATSLPATRTNSGFAGLQTAGLIFGGAAPSRTNTALKYDGTSWTSAPSLGTATQTNVGTGIQSAALNFGGSSSGTAALATTEEFTSSANVITSATWSSLPNVNNARRNAGCLGTTSATLYAGGFSPPYVNYSEEFNGTSWTEGNNLTIARECSTGGFGTQTAGAVAGGGAPDNIPYGYSNSTDEYDGTSWSEGGDINTARLGMATCGTQTAGFGAGGYVGASNPLAPPPNTARCEQYNGTAWSEVADLNTARSSMGHFGTSTASIAVRGSSNPTESWDGSSWTNISAPVNVFNGGNHGAGTQTSGLVFGPRTNNNTEEWNGTTWFSNVSYSTTRNGNSAGTSTSAILVGGYTGTANTNAAEEFTARSTALNVKTLTQS